MSGKRSISHFRSKINTNIRKDGVNLYKKIAELLQKENKAAYQLSKDTGIVMGAGGAFRAGYLRCGQAENTDRQSGGVWRGCHRDRVESAESVCK